MSGLLSGRVALVYGGGGEIGAATALRFADEGASVAVADFDLGRANEVSRQIIERGGSSIGLACDVESEEAIIETTLAVVKHFGMLTSLVNLAAAVTPAGTLESLTLEEWKKALDINLTGTFLTCKHAIPFMKRNAEGTIVNVSSLLGHIGAPMRAPYCSSKAGVLQLTKVIAIDYGPCGIRANTISPGAIDTARAALQRFPSREAANQAKGPSHVLNRVGSVEEIGSGILFLSSKESSFMTGTDLLVDGGYSSFKGFLNRSA